MGWKTVFLGIFDKKNYFSPHSRLPCTLFKLIIANFELLNLLAIICFIKLLTNFRFADTKICLFFIIAKFFLLNFISYSPNPITPYLLYISFISLNCQLFDTLDVNSPSISKDGPLCHRSRFSEEVKTYPTSSIPLNISTNF